MAQTDEEIKKLAEEAESQRKTDQTTQPINDIPIVVKLIIVWVASYILFFTDMLPWSNTIKFLVLMAIMAIVFIVTSTASARGELPEEKIAAIAYHRLLFFQTHKFGDNTRLPSGRIVMNPVGVPQFESWDSDKIKWWNHSFAIYSQVGSEVFRGIVRTHPLSGLSRGIVKIDSSFTGTEEPNLKFVGKEDLARTKWAKDKLNQFPPYEGMF